MPSWGATRGRPVAAAPRLLGLGLGAGRGGRAGLRGGRGRRKGFADSLSAASARQTDGAGGLGGAAGHRPCAARGGACGSENPSAAARTLTRATKLFPRPGPAPHRLVRAALCQDGQYPCPRASALLPAPKCLFLARWPPSQAPPRPAARPRAAPPWPSPACRGARRTARRLGPARRAARTTTCGSSFCVHDRPAHCPTLFSPPPPAHPLRSSEDYLHHA